MKYINFFLAVILMMALCVCPCWAQDYMSQAADSLGSVLSNLKQSVQRLDAQNQQLTSRGNAMRQEVYRLQLELGHLQEQGNVLNKTAQKLRDNNESRARQISRLEETDLGLDSRIQKTQENIRLVQQALQAAQNEDQNLLLQIQQMQGHQTEPVFSEPETSSDASRLQKEKLKLMKMIYDSQQKQDSLHQAIVDFEQQTPLVPAARALARQQVLKEQIKDLEGQIASLGEFKALDNPVQSNQWDETQLRTLEGELRALEKNYAQLKDVLGQMSKKVQGNRMTVGQHIEQGKLESNINDLKHQQAGLKADLEDLRSQMIELDKRKTYLEKLIRQP